MIEPYKKCPRKILSHVVHLAFKKGDTTTTGDVHK